MQNRSISLLILVTLLSIGSVYSQNESQKKGEEHSSEELKQMMKDMEQEMEDMDPEAKEMMKKMGIGMPDMKKLEFAVSGNYANEGRIPKRDAARIQKARQTTLNAGNQADYIRRVHQAVCA